MMTKAVLYAKEQGKKYIYLGSAQRPTDTYKLQFAGLEWFDGTQWQADLKKLTSILDS
jgi:arginyl-tRNA--protein-N-Asp/Glu arginylyltransferase